MGSDGGAGGSGIVIVKELNKASGVWNLKSQFSAIKQGTWPKPAVQPFSANFLVVAGGGAGGGAGNNGGGGGAGGFRTSFPGGSGGGASPESALTLTAGTAYPITVGAGGTGNCSPGQGPATTGNPSIFSTITSTGGGVGGVFSFPAAGTPGGSGGGAGQGAGTTGGTGTANQGFDGGNNNTGNSGAGGGGAGAVGQASSNSPYITGNGGIGVESSISGSPAYYSGGGGGGVHQSQPPATFPVGYGTGGTGGGGGGATSIGPRGPSPAQSGTANTGGGGGGSSEGISPRLGGNGGSGIIIVRYPAGAAPAVTVAPGTNVKTTAPNGEEVATFTVSGTLTVASF